MADDGLKIEVDADRTAVELMTASIDKLIMSVDKLVQATGKTSSVGDAFASFKLDPNVEKSLASLTETLKKMSETRISELQSQINSLKADQVQELTSAFDKLSRVTKSLQSGNIAEMSKALKDTATAANGVKTLGDALNKFWQDAAKAITGSGNLKSAMTSMSASFSEVSKVAGGTQQGIGAIASSMTSLSTVLTGLGVGAAVAALYKLGEVILGLGPSIIQVTEEAINLKATINAISAGTGEAAFASLRKIADETGLSIGALSKTFTQFVAGASTMGVSVEAAQAQFGQLVKGFRGAGASAQETEQAMRALTQMMGKGKVQAQELVLQLGNASAVGLKKMADALHTTTAGLMELSKAGALLPTNVVEKFAAEMERSFGGAVAERILTVTAQLAIMNNKFADLGRSVGNGIFVGLETGLATLISGFNNLLDAISPITNGIAALAGTIVGVALGAIGLLIDGFGNIIKGVEWAVTGLAKLGNFIIETFSGFNIAKDAAGAVQSALEAMGISLDGIGKRFGNLGQVIGTAAAGLLILVPAISAARTAYTAMVAVLELIVVWKNRATVATLALLAVTNPLQAAIAVAAAAAVGAAAAYLLYGNGVNKAAEDSLKFKASTDGVAYGAEQLANGGEKAAAAAVKLGAAFLTATGSAAALAVEHERLAESETRLKAEMESHADSMKQLEKGQQNLNREYEAAKNANAQEILDLQNKKSHWQDLDKIMQQTGTSTRGAGSAAGAASSDYGNLDRAIRDLGRDSKQIELDMKAAQDSFKDRQDREKAYQDGLKQTMAHLKEVEAWEKKYGVTSNETTREIIQMASAAQIFGKEAGAIASAYNNASKAATNFQGVMREEISKNEQLIAARSQLIEKMQGVVTALKEQEAAARKAGDALKADVFKGITDSSVPLITNLKNLNAEQVQLAIAQRALTDSEAGGAKTLELITQYAKEYAAANGKGVDATKLAEGAMAKLGDAAKALAGDQDGATNAGKKATEELAKQAKELKGTAENATKFAGIVKESAGYIDTANLSYTKLGTALANISSSADKVGPAFGDIKTALEGMSTTLATVAEGFTALAPAMSSAGTNAPALADALDTMATAVDTMAPLLPELASGLAATVEPINGLDEPLTNVATAFDTMSTALPPVSAAFAQFSVSVTAIAEPLKAVVTSLGLMAGYAEGLNNVATALGEVATKLGAISEAADKAVPSLSKVNPVLEGISTGFVKATENANGFGSALDKLQGNIDALISKMEALIQKAQEAMQAASAAAAAASSSSSSSDVSQQREGGYAGHGPLTSVAHSAFANAPHFAAGTTNTSNYTHALSNGGIPSILHPNEAVIPLSKGRSIPVELSHTQDNGAISSLVKGIVGGLTDTFKSYAEAPAANAVADTRFNNTNPKELTAAPAQATAPIRQSAAVDYAATSAVQSVSSSSASHTSGGRATTPNNAPVHIHMNISTPDADSFRKSKDQINAEMFNKMKTAFNKNA